MSQRDSLARQGSASTIRHRKGCDTAAGTRLAHYRQARKLCPVCAGMPMVADHQWRLPAQRVAVSFMRWI